MATLSVQTATSAGLNPTANAVSASDEFANDGKTLARVANGSGGSLTVTIVTPNTVDGGLAIADRTVTVPDGESRVIGPFPKSSYNDSSGNVTLQFSATTSVTVELFNT